MKEQEKYNGWTNYATWRVNLEVFDGYEPERKEVDHESVKEYAEEIIFEGAPCPSFMVDYASAFLSDVNWNEIADHLNEEQKETAQ